MVILFVILQNYKEGVRAPPVVLTLHENVSDCKLRLARKMSSQTITENMLNKQCYLKKSAERS